MRFRIATLSLLGSLLGLLQSLQAQATRPHWDCGYLLSQSPNFWAQTRAQLRQNLDQSMQAFNVLEVPYATIKKGNWITSGTQGAVYEATYQGKNAVIKIYHRVTDSAEVDIPGRTKIGRAVVFQNMLSQLGLAPRVLATFVHPNSQLLGVVMERLAAIPSQTFRNEMPHKLLALTRRERKLQVDQLAIIFRRLGIVPVDLQCMVADVNTLYLNDFDDYALAEDARTPVQELEYWLNQLRIKLDF